MPLACSCLFFYFSLNCEMFCLLVGLFKQADKEFVWSLWKRLQVANPDLTQAVSLVVEREKQKAEAKDRKVLEILQAKDYKIQALEQVLWHLLRMHQAVVAQDIYFCLFFVSLSLSLALPLQEREEEWGHVRSDLEESRRVLEEQCSGLQGALQRAQEQQEESRRQEAIKFTEQSLCPRCTNSDSLTEYLYVHSINSVACVCACVRSRELQELQGLYTQSVQHAGEQAELIQQLEGLNLDTQEVLHSQEQAHSTHTASYQQVTHARTHTHTSPPTSR
uniref:Centlein, centrosomal protein n=1 Tax=Electrophorus electricus TaxID=8005 RepID=A0A4W4HH82_ELEEL